jgi:hypothetical protein
MIDHSFRYHWIASDAGSMKRSRKLLGWRLRDARARSRDSIDAEAAALTKVRRANHSP